ncbi:hypothetical protein K438DRAFT_1996132 [Mycena galopus ATCC 62051]|nr:hypothetical protein K438DRAFT_1996132 [Mycena galopus ATCC 62051]
MTCETIGYDTAWTWCRVESPRKFRDTSEAGAGRRKTEVGGPEVRMKIRKWRRMPEVRPEAAGCGREWSWGCTGVTLTTTPNFLNLKISTQLTWMPEREKGSPVPPVPSCTPPARRLAQAKYRENHKEEEAEKSRIRIARYRASIKADPEHVQEQKDRQKCADKAYREK